MAEIWFYHMMRGGLDAVLPALLEKTLERGWRACVESPDQRRLEALDSHLWTYREESFLPHGLAGDGEAPHHPIVLTTDGGNPNGATLRVLIDGAEAAETEGYERIIYVFDGRDDAAVENARDYWKRVKAEGNDAQYWQQTERGGWERKA